MKRLIFQSLSILSQKEKEAIKVPFDPQMTVFRGTNDTGKSSLLKSVYRAFGAEPHKVSDKWKDASATLHLRFTLDEVPYSILRFGDSYSLFSGDDQLIIRCSSVTNDLGPYIAELCQFRLPLISNGKQVQATPAFLFLPFYFDQDGSWSKQWDGFERLRQFTKWKNDVVHFHTGIRPTEYYEAKVKREEYRKLEADHTDRRKVISDTLTKLNRQLAQASFDIDVESYQSDINRLLQQCNELNVIEEKHSEKLKDLECKRMQYLNEERIVRSAIAEITGDSTLAAKESDEVECPTCGNVYDNSFRERFSIAQDAGRCKELLTEILSDLTDVEREIYAVKAEFLETRAMSEEIKQTLSKKRGEIKLHDVIKSEGRKEVRDVLRGEIDGWSQKIGEAASSVAEAEAVMNSFDNKARRKDVIGFYRREMKRFVSSLDVMTLPEMRWRSITCSIQESGSDLPRALLAYYYAILRTINAYSTSTYCPIIMDSPRQQDLDEGNWEQMLEFIRDNQPEDSQLIISLVDDAGVALGGKEVILENKWSLLQGDQFEEIDAELQPFMDAHLLSL